MKSKYVWAGAVIAGAILILIVLVRSQQRHRPEDRQAIMLAGAVKRGDHVQIRELLARGANPNGEGGAGKTVLTVAKKLGDAQAVRLLEQAGATEGKQPKPSARGLAAHVFSQEWITLKEGEKLTFGGKEHRVYEDMAFVRFTFRLKNLSSKRVEIPVFAMIANESGAKMADVGVDKYAQELEPSIILRPGQEQVFHGQSVLPASLTDFTKNEPLYIRFLDYHPEGRMTIPEANITLFRWKTPEIKPRMKFSP